MRSVTESSEQNGGAQATGAPEVPPEQVRAALEKILASPGFANAERLTRFLRYVVEETLAGETDKLKETLLGIEVFGRKPSYDPRIDAVVRTEAVKLRARLRDYYETEGHEDAVLIDIPKGRYVPVFRQRQEPVAEVVPSPSPEVPPLIPAPNPAWWKTTAFAIVMIVVLAGSVWLAARKETTASARAPELASIAVLPFEDLSPQHDQEYFCDGMTEEIIDALTKVGGFRVVARTSSFAFKGKQQDIREIGRKLNVGAVLEGSVRKSGTKLRVTAQLNSVADGYHLWSETYEREVEDVFSLQDQISQAIVETLQSKLATQRPAHPKPVNVEAYDLYLKGRYHWGRWRTEGAEKALDYFGQAVAKDPSYAPAYAGLADSYCWLGFFSALRPHDAMPKAKAAAQRAIQLDEALPGAHAALGFVKALYDFDWPGAEREFKRSIELNPGQSEGHFGYGIAYLAPMGKVQDALREMKLARDLDPLSLAINTYLGLVYQMDGKLDQATVYYKKALELDPTFFEAHSQLANMFIHRGDFNGYYAEMDQAKSEPAGCRLELSRAYGLALQGKRSDALAAVHRWQTEPSGAYVRPTAVANVYAALGDRENAMAWLQKAYEDRDGMLVYLTKEGVYRSLFSDPRFIELRHKIGFH